MEDVEQYSDAAREQYLRSVDELISALRSHAELTVERIGRERELMPYFASAAALEQAAAAYNDAELGWCGSIPLHLLDDELEDGLDDDLDDDGVEDSAGAILSGFIRWDFTITDEAAVLAAGRDAHHRAWPHNTDEDATLAVPTADRAAAELIHLDGWTSLDDTPGLERRGEFWTFVQHNADADTEDLTDPFAFLRAQTE
ncbi:hypothetical protein [Kribbella sp. NPDC048915]|uniref:hypothetical protein n=1 Tax=Kribbella sp. NPDC048915 TaxID=3155148 RepID=UPI00340BE5D8